MQHLQLFPQLQCQIFRALFYSIHLIEKTHIHYIVPVFIYIVTNDQQNLQAYSQVIREVL